jgi:hypothetical protein
LEETPLLKEIPREEKVTFEKRKRKGREELKKSLKRLREVSLSLPFPQWKPRVGMSQ